MRLSGSDAEMSSGVAREQATVLGNLPAVARDGAGQPLVSAELFVMVELPRHGQTDPNNVPFRGVQPAAFAIRNEVRIVERRRYERGRREVIAGRKAMHQFAGLSVGSRIAVRASAWTLVGTFEGGGAVPESAVSVGAAG